MRKLELDGSAANESLLGQIAERLLAGRYQEAAELLHQLQLVSEQQGAELPARVLAMARKISLACEQCRSQTEWHQKAGAEVAQREQELRDQLQTLLDLLSDEGKIFSLEMPEARISQVPASASPAASEDRPELLQRIWNMFGIRLSQRAPAPSAQPEVALAGPTPPSAPDPGVSVPGAPSLAVYFLGPFRVYQNNQLVSKWTGFKGQSVLKYLLASEKRMVAKEVLMEVFWPDSDAEAARRNLHQAVYSLRQTLKWDPSEPQYIQFEHDFYLLNPDVHLWLDFEEVERRVEVGRRLERSGQTSAAMTEYAIAESLYVGDFLEEDLYEDWPRVQRQHLHSLYLDAADQLSRAYLERGEHAPAITLCHKILARDRCYEEAYRRLMKCYMAQGQRHLAVHQYQVCLQALREELDLAPSRETEALYQRMTASV